MAGLLLLGTILCSLHRFVSSGEVPTVYAQLGGEVTIVCDLDESKTNVEWTRGSTYEESQSKLVAFTRDGVEEGDCLSSGKCTFGNGRDLTINNVQLSDQDRYYCSASGKEYTEKLLSIRVEPNMPYPMINFCGDQQNCTFPFPVGYPMWLRCEVSGSIPSVDLTWYNDSNPIGDVKTEVRENIDGTFDSVSRLRIDYLTHGVFSCKAVGDSVPDERVAVAAINFTERDQPDFDDILPTNFPIVEPLTKYPRIFHCYDQADCTYEFPNGYNLLLTCEMEGSRPPVHLKWTNGTAVLEGTETVYNITNGLFNTFSTLEVEHNDTTVYYCVASGISLPGKLTASITVTGVDVPVAAPQEGLSGGGKAAVAAGGAVSIGVVAGVAREPIQKTGCAILKMIPRMGDNDSDTESVTRRTTRRKRKRKKKRKDRDVEADLEEDEQFIDDEEIEMNEVEGADDEVDASVHEEEEVIEDQIEAEEENIQMAGIPMIDDVESSRKEKEDEEEEEEEEEDEEAEDDVLLPRDTSKPEKDDRKKNGKVAAAATTARNTQSKNTGKTKGTKTKPNRKPASKEKTPTGKKTKSTKQKQQKQDITEEDEEEESSKFRFSSLLKVPKHGLDSLKDTFMEKVDDVATSSKDFIGEYLPSEAEGILDNIQEKLTDKVDDALDDKVKEVETYVEDKTDELQTSVEDKATELQAVVIDKVKGKQNANGLDDSKTQADEGKRGRARETSNEPRSKATDKTDRLESSTVEEEFSPNPPAVNGQTAAVNVSKSVTVLSSNTTSDLTFRTESTPLEMKYYQLEEDDVLIKFRMKGCGLKLKVCHGIEDQLYELSIEFLHKGKISILKNGHPVKLTTDQVKSLSYKPEVLTSFAINISQYQLVIIVDDGKERSAKFKVHSELCHFIGIGQIPKGNFDVTFFPKKGKKT